MAMIELSQPLRDTLKRLGEVEENALKIFIRGLRELLKECEEEILNYKFWHYHPVEDPNIHISCEEPTVPFVIQQIRGTHERWRQYRGGK